MLHKNNKRKISDIIKNEDLIIKYPNDLSENLKKAIENFIFFLSIISASAILISGIGLTNSLFSLLSSNQLNIAIFKSLGLSSKNIKLLYYLQTIIVLIFCSFLSYILSLFIISFLDNTVLGFLNIELDFRFKFYELLLIQFLVSSFFLFLQNLSSILLTK